MGDVIVFEGMIEPNYRGGFISFTVVKKRVRMK